MTDKASCSLAVANQERMNLFEERFNALDSKHVETKTHLSVQDAHMALQDEKLDLLVKNTSGWVEFVQATKWIRRIILYIVPVIIMISEGWRHVHKFFSE